MEMVLRAALLQMDIEWGKPAANRAVAGRLVRALHDTDIAFLPEMFTTGFMAADTALAEPMEGPSVEWMRCTAAETGIALAGSLIIGDGRERPYNRFVFAFPDGRIDWYDKRHLFRSAAKIRCMLPDASGSYWNTRVSVSCRWCATTFVSPCGAALGRIMTWLSMRHPGRRPG